MGKIYYLIGKSAVGKDHIYEKLIQDENLSLRPIISYTTRPMREGEEEGREYHFTTESGMKKLRESGKIIEERVYHTINGPWYYFTADDGSIDTAGGDYLAIGTLESFRGMKQYFGKDVVVPVYIETEDGLRLQRAMQREKKQEKPDYAEVCRRYLGDEKDFSENKLQEAGIRRRFSNNGDLEDCAEEIRRYIAR